MWPVQSQEWKIDFLVPQATNSIWRREMRIIATPMRSLSVGVANLYWSVFSIAVGVVLTTEFSI